jgi:hypothetical protein
LTIGQTAHSWNEDSGSSINALSNSILHKYNRLLL